MTSQVQIPENLSPITRRGVSRIISEEEFTAMLQRGRPLRLKMGFDPSRPDIHLGHVVGLRKLRQLQDLGHQVILIVGDWTAQIGDPSGRSATRTMLTHAEVLENAESYMRQFFKVVDRERTQVEWQSQWFGEFTLANVIELTSRFTINQFLHREDFANRYAENRPIAITEMLYPLMQAYDSVVIESDVEFGGTDQMFNLLVGRELQGMMGQTPQQCFMMPILVGTDGVQKMSKSLGNYVALEEPPEEMYGKLMSLPDNLIVSYYEYLTDVPDADIAEMQQAMASETANPHGLQEGSGSLRHGSIPRCRRRQRRRIPLRAGSPAPRPPRRHTRSQPVRSRRPAHQPPAVPNRPGVQQRRSPPPDWPGRRRNHPPQRPARTRSRRCRPRTTRRRRGARWPPAVCAGGVVVCNYLAGTGRIPQCLG